VPRAFPDKGEKHAPFKGNTRRNTRLSIQGRETQCHAPFQTRVQQKGQPTHRYTHAIPTQATPPARLEAPLRQRPCRLAAPGSGKHGPLTWAQVAHDDLLLPMSEQFFPCVYCPGYVLRSQLPSPRHHPDLPFRRCAAVAAPWAPPRVGRLAPPCRKGRPPRPPRPAKLPLPPLQRPLTQPAGGPAAPAALRRPGQRQPSCSGCDAAPLRGLRSRPPPPRPPRPAQVSEAKAEPLTTPL
jgi:hypothetical protein